MDGFKFNDAADIKVGETLAKQVYVGSTKVWDAITAPVYTAPTKKTGLVYSGAAQDLLNAGVSSHGTFYYSTDGTNWGTSIPQSTNAGTTAKLYWKLVGDSRHSDVASTEITNITISQKSLTITAKAQSVTYGTAISTGISQVNVSGLVSGDSLTAVTLTASTGNVTTSGTITPSAAATTNGIGNYSVTYSTGTLTITAKAITITAKAQTITYGSSISTGTGQVTVSGLVGSDSLTAISLAASTTDYPGGTITPSAATIKNGTTDYTGNYSISYSTGTLTINKATPVTTFTVDETTYPTTAYVKFYSNVGGTIYETYNGTQLTESNYSTAKQISKSVTAGNGTSTNACTVDSGSSAHSWTIYAYFVPTSSNYSAVQLGPKTLKVNKADPTYVAPTAKTLTYNGSAQSLVNAGTNTTAGSFKYAIGTATQAAAIPTATNANTSGYTVNWTFTPTDTTNYNTKTGSVNVPIAKASPNIYPQTLTYNRGAQTLVSKTGDGTFYWRIGTSGSFSTTLPSATNAATYTVQFYVTEGTNYKAIGSSSSPSSIFPKINRATPVINANPTAVSGWTYDGSAHNLLQGGSVKHSSTDSTAVAGTFTYTKKTDAGTYTSAVWSFEPNDDTNYTGISGNITGISVVVSKASVHTAPVANSTTYTGSAITLLKNGSANGKGTLEYSANGTSGWSTTCPSQTTAGGYDTWWRFTPTDTTNHVTVSATKITTTISKASVKTGTVNSPSVTFSTSSQTVSVSVSGASGTVTYPTSITVKNSGGTTLSGWSCTSAGVLTIPANIGSGTYTITGTVSVAASTNYNSGSASKTWTLTVNAKSISIPTPTNASKVYDATAATGTFGACTGATITKYRYSTNGSSWTESTTNPSQTAKGTLYTQAYYTASTNYTGSGWSSSATISISVRPINITAASSSRAYNGMALTNNSATAEATGTNRGLVSGHSMTSCTVTGTITNVGSANNVPSSAVIKSGSTDVTSNYSITYVNGTLTVSKATLDIALFANDRAYNGNALYAVAVLSSPMYGVAPKGTIYYGTSSGATTYSVAYNSSEVNLSSVSQTNAGSKTVYAYFVPDSTCNAYYNNSANRSCTFTVSKANPTITAPTAKSNLTYSGSSQTLYNAGSNTTAGSFSYSNGTRTAAGSQTVTWSFTPTDTTNYNSKNGSFTGSIAKASPVVSGRSLTYNRGSQTLVSVTGDGTFHYKVGSGSWSTTAPSATNAATYTIYWYMDEGTNYKATNSSSSAGSVSTTIAKVRPVVATLPSAVSDWTYDGSAHNLLSGGAMKHSSSDSTAVAGTFTYQKVTNAGIYSSATYDFTPTDTTNYNGFGGVVSNIDVAVLKATGSATVSGRTVTYSRGAQNIVSVSNATGTMHYRVGTSGSWTTTIPTRTNAGSDTIYYYMDASTNYTARGSSSSPWGSVTGTVNKCMSVLSTHPTPAYDWTYDGTTRNLASGGAMKHSSSDSTAVAGTFTYDTAQNAGTYYAVWHFTPTDTTNYYSFSGDEGRVIVYRASRTLSFTTAPTSVVAGATITVAASPSAGSGDGTITFSSNNTSVATVSGSTITGVAAGSVTITASISQGTNYNSASTSYTLTVIAEIVDMGNGLKFRNRNIGATNPEDTGLYFSWGNIDGHENGYNFGTGINTSPYKGSSGASLTTNIPSNATYDAAYANISSHWRLPTNAEWVSLDGVCNKTQETVNGVVGVRFTSTITGNSIFIPYSGYIQGSTRSKYGSLASLWSSTYNNKTTGYVMTIRNGSTMTGLDNLRSQGLAIRPIYVP